MWNVNSDAKTREEYDARWEAAHVWFEREVLGYED